MFDTLLQFFEAHSDSFLSGILGVVVTMNFSHRDNIRNARQEYIAIMSYYVMQAQLPSLNKWSHIKKWVSRKYSISPRVLPFKHEAIEEVYCRIMSSDNYSTGDKTTFDIEHRDISQQFIELDIAPKVLDFPKPSLIQASSEIKYIWLVSAAVVFASYWLDILNMSFLSVIALLICVGFALIGLNLGTSYLLYFLSVLWAKFHEGAEDEYKQVIKYTREQALYAIGKNNGPNSRKRHRTRNISEYMQQTIEDKQRIYQLYAWYRNHMLP